MDALVYSDPSPSHLAVMCVASAAMSYKKVSHPQGPRSSPTPDLKGASLRKIVLVRCLLAQRRSPPPGFGVTDCHSSSSDAGGEMSDFSAAPRNKQTNSSRAPRRRRTHLPGAQRIIMKRIDEIKQCMRSVHIKARLLRQEAALQLCPPSYTGSPKAYFTNELQHLRTYTERYTLDWETELQTLLGALRERPWDKRYWHNSLNMILDS
ncbi:hypothetical protein C8R47DRAFT_1195753 [Mycena vitilis]|nr:hypothetical protein C8R47DRAFT_1195753 [Mycena vitilis]